MKAIQNNAHLDKKERKFYVNKKCNCAKNEVTFFQQNHISIAKQVIHVSLKREKRKKR
jgi:arsenate reductase-like glutaredoxin family protein